MNDGAFGFAHAVFHVVLFFVVHGRLVRPSIKPKRNHSTGPKRNSSVSSNLRARTHKTVNTLNERSSHEARSSISEPVALSQELQTRAYPPFQAGEVGCPISPGAFRSKTANQNSDTGIPRPRAERWLTWRSWTNPKTSRGVLSGRFSIQFLRPVAQ